MKKDIQPLLIGKAEHLAKEYLELWERAKEDLQNVLNQYQKTGLPELANTELVRLFTDTVCLLYDKITGGSNTHVSTTGGGHIAIDKSAAMAIIAKPAGYDVLMESIKNYIGKGHKYYKYTFEAIGFPVAELDKYFVLYGTGNLQYSNAHVTKIDEKGKMYINTKAGQDTYKFCQDIGKAFFDNNMDKHLPRNGAITTDNLFEFLNNVMSRIDYTTHKVISNYNPNGGGYYADGLKSNFEE